MSPLNPILSQLNFLGFSDRIIYFGKISGYHGRDYQDVCLLRSVLISGKERVKYYESVIAACNQIISSAFISLGVRFKNVTRL